MLGQLGSYLGRKYIYPYITPYSKLMDPIKIFFLMKQYEYRKETWRIIL